MTTRLQAALDDAARRHGVPGMSAAVLRDGVTETAVHGVTHVGRPAPMTPETAFGVQSVTKTMNTTLVLQVLADRLEDLDLPVTTWVGPRYLSRPDLAPRITLRHLLTHTSGLDAELFLDCGDGDDALARWVEHLPGLGFLGEPGEVFSYSNAGMLLAGHVLERIEGRPWTALVRERVLDPLGLDSSWTEGERPRADVSAGHSTGSDFSSRDLTGVRAVVLDPAEDPTRTRVSGPCGGWVATPAQVVRWASEHLDGGSGVVPRQVREAMRVPHVTKPPAAEGVVQQCIGWVQHAWEGMQVLGHEGHGLGQTSSLRVVPEAGLVVMVSSNVGDTAPMNEVVEAVLGSVPGLRRRPFPADRAPAPPEERRRALGTYERRHYRFTISEDPADPTGPLRMAADTDPAFVPVYTDGPVSLTPYDDGTAEVSDGRTASFLGDAGAGRARWFHIFGRAHPRVEAPPAGTP